jgi:hypothetical protein
VDDLILPTNSCPIEITKGVRGGVRVRLDKNGYEIQIRNANGDFEYIYCNKQANLDNFWPYVGVVATNQNAMNDIDILAMYVKNSDPNNYQDKNLIEEERLKFLLKKQQGGIDPDGTVHAHDLLSI